jgi:hypothetical protein
MPKRMYEEAHPWEYPESFSVDTDDSVYDATREIFHCCRISLTIIKYRTRKNRHLPSDVRTNWHVACTWIDVRENQFNFVKAWRTYIVNENWCNQQRASRKHIFAWTRMWRSDDDDDEDEDEDEDKEGGWAAGFLSLPVWRAHEYFRGRNESRCCMIT